MSLRVARAGESKLYGIFRFALKTVEVQPVSFGETDWLRAESQKISYERLMHVWLGGLRLWFEAGSHTTPARSLGNLQMQDIMQEMQLPVVLEVQQP